MRTTVVNCDRCGQGPLPSPVPELSLSNEIAKEVPTIVQTRGGAHVVELCKPCVEKFVLFMLRSEA